MDELKLLYKNNGGTCIVKISETKYYYGNGKTFGGYGVAPNQFLRFNPYLDYVGDENLPVPDVIRKWIAEHNE